MLIISLHTDSARIYSSNRLKLRCFILCYYKGTMEMKNNMWVVGGGMLLVGVVVGGLLTMCIGKSDWHRGSMSGGMDKWEWRGEGVRMGEGSDMHGAMNGMMSNLEGKTGEEFEKAFLEEMIVHHEGAVKMAEGLITQTRRPELITLGREIITAQMREIEQMKSWHGEWFANKEE